VFHKVDVSCRYSTRPEQGSCAVLRTDAPRLAPLQRALMDLVRYSPATALKLGAAPQVHRAPQAKLESVH
jgi:hypothetical protein